MVQFDEIFKSLELREVLLKFLEQKLHPWLMRTFSIDIDSLQAKVHSDLPAFNFKTFVMLLVGSIVYWQVQLMAIHYVVQMLLWVTKPYLPSNKMILSLDKQRQWMYSLHYHTIAHAVFGVLTAFYGFIYADGQIGTTWFHCNFYKLHMFDIQRVFSTISTGFYLQVFLFSVTNQTKVITSSQIQNYMYQISLISGNLIGLYVGGFFGSVQQISFIVEASTPFKSIQSIISAHKNRSSLVYHLNEMILLVTFLIFRAFFFYYMVFWKFQDMLMYRWVSFWQTYPKNNWRWCQLWIVLYIAHYVLNLFWFSKILWAFFRAIGLEQAIIETERVIEDEDSDESQMSAADTDETDDYSNSKKYNIK